VLDPLRAVRALGRSGRRLHYAATRGRRPPTPRSARLAGEIDVDALLSHRLRPDQVNHGFELMEAQDGIRSVIAFP
jgi:S-(hydroxymethyl)glutathione dehydrogenase/alcohol dehydrogenase